MAREEQVKDQQSEGRGDHAPSLPTMSGAPTVLATTCTMLCSNPTLLGTTPTVQGTTPTMPQNAHHRAGPAADTTMLATLTGFGVPSHTDNEPGREQR